jgi:hypothetical protein
MNLALAVMLALTTGGYGDDAPASERREKYGNAVEVSFGYLGQWADERNRALELKPSSTDPSGAAWVTDPFLGAPYSGAILAGPVLEWRGIYNQVRLTVGVRFPFTNFRPSDTAQTVEFGGATHEVLVRSMSLWDFRTGIGFEVPFKRVSPFFDVLGDVQTMTTQLSIDGQPATYTGRAFSLGGRLGARYQVDHLFVALAVEATALGPLRLGGTLQVGLGF